MGSKSADSSTVAVAEMPGAPNAQLHLQKPTRIRVFVVFVLFVTLLVAYLDRVNVSVLIANPRFLTDMGLLHNPVGQGLLMTLFLVAYAAGNVLLSPIGDRLGPRRTMCIALTSWTVPCVIGAMSHTLPVIYGSRLLLGLGEAMHYPMLVAFVKNWFPLQERGRANAVWVVGQMLGPAVSMPLFSVIIARYSWRDTFWICAMAGAALIPVMWFFTADRPEQSKWANRAEVEHILKGQKTETAKQGTDAARSSAWSDTVFLLKNSSFLFSMLSYYAAVAAWWGLMSWLPQYLRIARGFSWAKMGVLASLPFVMGTFAILIAGFIADRLKRSAPMICIGLAGTGSFLLLGATVHSAYLSAAMISVAMFFKGLAQPMAWSVVQAIAPARMVGQATGLQNGSAMLIGALSPVIMGFLISVTGTYTAGLIYLASFLLVGAGAAYVLVRRGY
jgi:sugar phosphate permease